MKISSILRYAPVVCALIAAVCVYVIYFAITEERDILLQHAQMTKLGYELEAASDFLTEQARGHVQYGEKPYLDAYLKEASETKTRERVLSDLKDLDAPAEEIDMVSQAIELSYQLEELEMRAFQMVQDGKLDEARQLLFGKEYILGKEPILNMIALFQETVQSRCDAESKGVKYLAIAAILLITGTASIAVCAVFFSANLINGRIKNMLGMQSAAQKLASGDFDIDLQGYESNDEFGLLAKSLHEMQRIVVRIKDEIGDLVHGVSTGNLSYKADATDFHGGWALILNGLNELMYTVRGQMIDRAPIAFFVLTDSVITDCNIYAREHIGMKPGAMITDYYNDLAERNRLLAKLEATGVIDGESVFIRMQNGEIHRFCVYLSIAHHFDTRTLIFWGVDMEEKE